MEIDDHGFIVPFHVALASGNNVVNFYHSNHKMYVYTHELTDSRLSKETVKLRGLSQKFVDMA